MMNDKQWNQETRERYYYVDDKKVETKEESKEIKTVDKILLRGHSQPQLLAPNQQQHQGKVNDQSTIHQAKKCKNIFSDALKGRISEHFSYIPPSSCTHLNKIRS